MQICILTHGRESWFQQHTAKQLEEAGIPYFFVVQRSSIPKWRGAIDGRRVILLPDKVTDVSATRDWLIHEHEGTDRFMLMLDDDLQFAARRLDDPTKFRQPTPDDIREMIRQVAVLMGTYPMVGIAPREGGNRNIEPLMVNTRIMRAMAFDRKVMAEKMITFAPLHLMEDFHVNLQFLRAGYDTCVLNKYVTNQAGGSNAPGGCSLYRTDALQTASANKLAALHPGFVRTVLKPSWSGQGMRTDVTVQWKAARKSAL